MSSSDTVPSTANVDGGKDKGAWSRTKKAGGGILGYGFIGVDAYSRIKEGENPVMAIGKAALTNAAWNLLPGGLPLALAIGAAGSLPDVMNQMKGAKTQLSGKKRMWNNNFEDTESSQNLRDMDMDRMDNSRAELSRAMSGFARRNNTKVY